MEDRMLSDEILLGLIKKAGGDVSKVAAEVAAIKDGTNIDSFADVETALAGKADNDIVADAFSAAETYAEGDYCTYEGGLYKFKTSHSGAWDAADVDQIQIAGELSELKNTLTYSSYGTIDTSTMFRGVLCKVSNIAFLEISKVKSLSTGETVLTGKIPVGYRPKVNFDFTLIERGLSFRSIAFKVYTNGDINIYNYGSAISSEIPFGDTISWPIGS